MAKYAVEVRVVALKLMEAILEGLGIGKEYMQEKFEEGLQLLSVNCYPKVSQSDTSIGLAAHSDYGLLTILLTSCQGLEVVDRSSNSWKVVQQLPHALHVHVGDHMEVLSNGRIKTVVHRAVLNPQEARILSLAFMVLHCMRRSPVPKSWSTRKIHKSTKKAALMTS